jgi:signal transduction histidine kinase
MILLVVVASILIAAITIYQYNEQTEDYHKKRLERKEEALKSAVTYELYHNAKNPLDTTSAVRIISEKINEISDIHNIDLNIYDLDGKLISSSNRISQAGRSKQLSKEVLLKIRNNPDNREVVYLESGGDMSYRSSYYYILNPSFKRVGIIGVPYIQDSSFQDKELKEFLGRLFMVYLVILFIAILIAYFLSNYITKSIQYVSERLKATELGTKNEKIILNDTNDGIYALVNSYNKMVDQLEVSAVKLAEVERKQAWREMARQVAHEIKNPLTPMRLTIQSFEHTFDPNDPDIKNKVSDFTESLVQQIDTMSTIASAFSSFAEMPKQNKERLNVVSEVKIALDIFHEPYIKYHPDKEEIYANLDKIQLTRIVTNLVTNAIQALHAQENPFIDVRLIETGEHVIIQIADNGEGISQSDAHKIFEPKFTTKSSGMGLGLSMVKNIIEAYGGSINFNSEVNEGTTFIVTLPKN